MKESLTTKRNNYNKLLEDTIKGREKLLDKKAREIQKVEIKYQDELDCNQNLTNSINRNIHDINELTIKYSKFNINVIAPVLIRIINKLEAEDYRLSLKECKMKLQSTDRYGDANETYRYYVYLIEKERDKDKKYDLPFYPYGMLPKAFSKLDPVMLLDSVDKSIEEISFYGYSGFPAEFSRVVDLKDFSYLYEFIDELINYRYEQDGEVITEEELENLAAKFIKIKKGLAKKMV